MLWSFGEAADFETDVEMSILTPREERLTLAKPVDMGGSAVASGDNPFSPYLWLAPCHL